MPTITQRIYQLPGDRRDQLAASLDSAAETLAAEPIAVLGIGCRFPGGAESPAALWRLLVEGRDAVREGPHDRWDVAAFYDADPAAPGRTVSRWAAYLDDVESFDAAFFGIGSGEAAAMDPQHRLLLEVSWEALEHAGIGPDSLGGTRTGVFAGLVNMEYGQRMAGRYAELDAYVGTGNAYSVAVGRISYLLGLTGPSVAVDTACSSSLVAIHLACQSLRLRESDLALTGGCNLLLRPEAMIIGSRWGMFSPSGHCYPFDARADGYVRGEGAAMVVLKRLTDALRDGDRVLAVVRGSAVNQDGRSQGLTAPSPASQRAVLRAAVTAAGVDPADVGLVETHGTGTPLGDPIEFAALADVYGSGSHRCALGAVKSNLGHTEAAAGVAGFVKAVLSVRHGVVPPNPHFSQWNPQIAWRQSRFFVPVAVTGWPAPAETRLAAVSSFGMSGTNAHLVLEEAPRPDRPVRETGSTPYVFPLSAGSPSVVGVAARRLAGWLAAERVATPLRDIAHTLATRRSHRTARVAVVARTRDELIDRLSTVSEGDAGTGRGSGHRGPVWVFSGQGSQWTGMGRRMLAVEPAFAEVIDELEPLIAAQAGFSVTALLHGDTAPVAIDRIQPALFAVSLALAASWRAHGVEPAAVIGHSMGEVTAAVVAGALSPADGVRVVCLRSRLLAGLAGTGAMVSVDLPPDAVQAELDERGEAELTVAVLASPRSTVVAGGIAAVERITAEWRRRGLLARPVAVDVAAHSTYVQPVLADLVAGLAGLRPRQPAIPVFSTVYPGTMPAPDAAYWAANLRRPVRFGPAVTAAARDGYRVFIEVSPHPVLVHPIGESAPGLVAVPTLRRDRDELETLYAQLAELYRVGVPIDWSRKYGDGELADLPTITWDRRRHWIDLPLPRPDGAGSAVGILHELRWERAPLGIEDGRGNEGHVLVLGEDGAAARQLGERLRSTGVRNTTLSTVEEFKRAVAATGQPVRAVVALACAADEDGLPGELDRAPDRLARLGQVVTACLGRDGVTPPRLWIVTRGAHAVDSTADVRPDQRAVRGFSRVVMSEHAQLRPTLVDLDPDPDRPSLVDLVAELAADRAEDEVAWRGGQRWVARVRAMEPGRWVGAADPVVAGGSYLITGGLGGLGVEMAAWLARGGAARIVLNGRRAASTRAGQAIAGLRAGGTQVEVVTGDVAEPGVAERLVAAAIDGGSALRGVVHAAGVTADARLAHLDAATVRRAWRPKAVGAWRLHEATAGHELDWFVLFSSVASLFGFAGQAGYAAANAWLDGFASWRRARGLPALSVDWGPWRDLGMTAGATTYDYPSLTVQEGVEALESLLRSDRTNAAVFHFDRDKILDLLPYATRSSFVAGLMAPSGGAAAGGGAPTQGTIAATLARVEPNRRRAVLADCLRERIHAVLGVLPRDGDSLADLGFDSLTAVALRNRLEHDLGITVPAAAVWTYPDIPQLAGYLLAHAGLAPDGAVVRTTAGDGAWLLHIPPRPAATLRLVCFPHLGGAASAYRPWTRALPDWIELNAVQPPGRENRATEAPPTDLRELVDGWARALADEPDRRPFAFFGHSAGGLLAFETARSLRRLGGPYPVLVGISAMCAPQDPRWTTAAPDLAGVAPAVSDDPARGDALMFARYRYEPEAPLDCPISVFAGEQDEIYQPAELDPWRRQSSTPVVFHSYPGDHSYLRERLTDVIADLVADLVRSAAGDGLFHLTDR